MIDATTVEVLVTIFVATVIRSALGFGEALVAVPLLALVLPVGVAAPLAVMISVTVAVAIVAQDWRHIEWRSAVWLVVASLVGIPLGLLLLTRAGDAIVRVVLGTVIVGFSSFSLSAGLTWKLEEDRKLWMVLFGFVSGVMGGAFGMNGPPLVIYGALRRWSPQQFRATLQGYFLPASAVGLTGYGMTGLFVPAVTHYYLLALPVVVVAFLIGNAANRRLRGDAFIRYVYIGLIVTGIALIVQALHA